MSKYHISYLKITNNQRLINAMGTDVFEIVIGDNNFIGIVGENGSGKSTIQNELNPFPIYGVYVPYEIGYKDIWFESDEDIIKIQYIFEPKKDTHSCKCYIGIYNKKDGHTDIINPNGLLKNGVDLISSLLKINKKKLETFNLSYDSISFSEYTTAERRNYIRSVLEGIDEIEEHAKNINEKHKHIKNIFGATKTKLDSIKDPEVIKNNLLEEEDKLKILTEKKYLVLDKKHKKDELEKRYDSLSILLETLNTKEIHINDIILNKSSFGFTNNQDDSLMSHQNHISLLLHKKNNARDDIHKKILQLETYEEKMKFRDTNISYFDDDRFKLLTEKYQGISKELVDVYTKLKNSNDMFMLKNFINNLEDLYIEHNIQSIDIEELESFMSLDEQDQLDLIKSVESKIHEITNVIEQKKENIIKYDYINQLYSMIGNSKKCIKCKIVDKIAFWHEEYMDLIKNSDSENSTEYKHLQEKAEGLYLLLSSTRKLNSAKLFFDSKKDILKLIFPDIKDFFTFLKNNSFDIQKKKLNSYLNDVNEYQEYLRMIEISKLSNELEDQKELFNIQDIDTLREESEIINQDIKTYREYLRVITELINSDCAFDDVAYIDIKMLPFELDKIQNEKLEKEQERAELKTLLEQLADIEQTLENYNNTIKDTQDKIDNLKFELKNRERLVDEFNRYFTLSTNIEDIHRVLSNELISKIIKKFMFNLKNITNNFFIDVGLPYEIQDIILNNTEFTVPILNKNTNIISQDISMMSAGERSLNGMGISFACQEILSNTYNTATLDEVDTLLDPENRVKFLYILLKFIETNHKQVFIISHNGNFDLYKDRMALIVLKGGTKIDGVNEVLWDYENI